MLAFDIETDGLDCNVGHITVACVYDPEQNIKRAFNFVADPSKYEDEKQEFIKSLDDATTIIMVKYILLL